MVNVFGGKDKSNKLCGYCRYYIKRRAGSFNSGYGVSPWGYCDGNKDKDLTGRGIRFIGLVHKNMVCQLPNVGKEIDWKPIVRAPPGMKRARPYSSHPSNLKNVETRAERYDRMWALERNREVKK